MRIHTLLGLMLVILPLTASSDSMRCGKWVVNETASSAEILEKCGEPQQKSVAHEDVYARNTLGHTDQIGVKVTERWIYKRSTGSLPMQVTIVDGKVVSVQRAE